MNAVPSIRQVFQLHVGLTPFQPWCTIFPSRLLHAYFKVLGLFPYSAYDCARVHLVDQLLTCYYRQATNLSWFLRHCLSCRASKPETTLKQNWSMEPTSGWWITIIVTDQQCANNDIILQVMALPFSFRIGSYFLRQWLHLAATVCPLYPFKNRDIPLS